MGCSTTLCSMYRLCNAQILLLALPLFQTSALSLHLEHLESFPQTLSMHRKTQLLTMLRGYSLWHLDPKPISQRTRVSLYFCQGREIILQTQPGCHTRIHQPKPRKVLPTTVEGPMRPWWHQHPPEAPGWVSRETRIFFTCSFSS